MFMLRTGNFSSAASNFRAEVESFNPLTQEWTTLAPLPYARGDQALVTLPGERMFVMGGETGDLGDGRTSVRHCISIQECPAALRICCSIEAK